MYINKTQAETIFDLIAREDEKLSLGEYRLHFLTREDEKLSLGEYRLHFLTSRQEMVELLEKIAPVIAGDGWIDDPVWTAQAHRNALEHDLAEKRAQILAV